MAVSLHLGLPKKIPWSKVLLILTILGCGAMGWQLWQHGIDRPISDASIRSQQLRLSSADLQRLQEQLTAYHQTPTTSETLKGDPLTPTKSATGTTP